MQVHAFGTTEVPPFSFCWRDGAGVSWALGRLYWVVRAYLASQTNHRPQGR